jgi:hypothetical protein
MSIDTRRAAPARITQCLETVQAAREPLKRLAASLAVGAAGAAGAAGAR